MLASRDDARAIDGAAGLAGEHRNQYGILLQICCTYSGEGLAIRLIIAIPGDRIPTAVAFDLSSVSS
jgi:hypothetical protein